MYGGNLGRFTSTDPILTSAKPMNPQSWNRYLYSLNNPELFIDPTGLYVWDKSLGGTSSDNTLDLQTRMRRKNFRDALAAAQKNADKVKTIFGEHSTEYAKAKAAVDSYGKEGDKGVTIKMVADTDQKTAGRTTGSNGNFVVSFKESCLNQFNGLGEQRDFADPMGSLIAHEGYHVATNAESSYEAEHDAYSVQANLERAWNPVSSYIDLPKSSYPALAQDERVNLWDQAWRSVDIDANREKSIKRILEVAYPQYKPKSTSVNKKKP